MAPRYLGNGLTEVEKIPDVPIRELSKTNVKIDSLEITTGTWNIVHFGNNLTNGASSSAASVHLGSGVPDYHASTTTEMPNSTISP